MVRAKFTCISKTQTAAGFEICMEPVTCGSKENETFFRFTPCGSIKFGTVNADSAKEFIPGDECYIDFTPCKN